MEQHTIKTMRNELINTFEKLREGEIGLSEAKQLANVAGKIFSSAKLQLEYNRYAQSKAKIAFLESED